MEHVPPRCIGIVAPVHHSGHIGRESRFGEDARMEDQSLRLRAYLAILRRHAPSFLYAALPVLFASLAVAVTLPPVYRSTATVLIEQEMPEDLVRSPVTSYAAEHVQLIHRRVTTGANLMEVIDKHSLYQGKGEREPIEAVLDQMVGDIHLEMVSAEINDPESSGKREAVIAFTIGYEASSPHVAKDVADDLASLYLDENIRIRRRQSAETSEFLAEQAKKIQARVTALESELAKFKERNLGQLPEDVELNLRAMERARRELMEVEHQILTQERSGIALGAHLAQLTPTIGSTPAGGEETLLAPEDQLRALEARYLSLSARYASSHPDLVRMRRRIAALRAQVGAASASNQVREDVRARLDAVRTELAVARKSYAPDHPEVKRLSRIVASLSAQLNDIRTKGDASAGSPRNPAYLETKARLEATEAELKDLALQKRELEAKIASFEEKLRRIPRVERRYRALMRDYDTAVQELRELTAKQLEAQLAESLESARTGERFTLVEPPQLPESPVKPDRLLLVLVGVVLSVGAGITATSIAEAMDRTVRGPRQIARLTGEPPLAVISPISIPGSAVRRAVAFGLSAAIIIWGTLWGLLLLRDVRLPLEATWPAISKWLGV